MNDNRNQFEIEFDTKVYPGKILVTQVSLQTAVMGEGDMANLALCEHPLYPILVEYCNKNAYRPPVRNRRSKENNNDC